MNNFYTFYVLGHALIRVFRDVQAFDISYLFFRRFYRDIFHSNGNRLTVLLFDGRYSWRPDIVHYNRYVPEKPGVNSHISINIYMCIYNDNRKLKKNMAFSLVERRCVVYRKDHLYRRDIWKYCFNDDRKRPVVVHVSTRVE